MFIDPFIYIESVTMSPITCHGIAPLGGGSRMWKPGGFSLQALTHPWSTGPMLVAVSQCQELIVVFFCFCFVH